MIVTVSLHRITILRTSIVCTVHWSQSLRQRYSVFPHASPNEEVQRLQWCPHSAVNACQSLFSKRPKSLFLTARNLLWCRTVFSPFATWSGNQSPVVPSFCTETTAVPVPYRPTLSTVYLTFLLVIYGNCHFVSSKCICQQYSRRKFPSTCNR